MAPVRAAAGEFSFRTPPGGPQHLRGAAATLPERGDDLGSVGGYSEDRGSDRRDRACAAVSGLCGHSGDGGDRPFEGRLPDPVCRRHSFAEAFDLKVSGKLKALLVSERASASSQCEVLVGAGTRSRHNDTSFPRLVLKA